MKDCYWQRLSRSSPGLVRLKVETSSFDRSYAAADDPPRANPLQDGAEAQDIVVFPPATDDLQPGRQSIRAEAVGHR